MPTVDELQNKLREEVFHYAADSKKAAGRALGTLVELITYYKVKSWGFGPEILIETHISEFGNEIVTHNVEFSLHRKIKSSCFEVKKSSDTVGKRQLIYSGMEREVFDKTGTLINKKKELKNSFIVNKSEDSISSINIIGGNDENWLIELAVLELQPSAMFECKRVGVQEGMKKGPQTIEKAKQGAYVARTVSALQRITNSDGTRLAFLPHKDGSYTVDNYDDVYKKILSGEIDTPPGFMITVGVASNHGNWFTQDNMNKELVVLADAYDYLLFLTDSGLGDFIDSLIINPEKEFEVVKETFLRSYTGKRGNNSFTKSKIDIEADLALRKFFESNVDRTNDWFNVLTPRDRHVHDLFEDMREFIGR